MDKADPFEQYVRALMEAAGLPEEVARAEAREQFAKEAREGLSYVECRCAGGLTFSVVGEFKGCGETLCHGRVVRRERPRAQAPQVSSWSSLYQPNITPKGKP